MWLIVGLTMNGLSMPLQRFLASKWAARPPPFLGVVLTAQFLGLGFQGSTRASTAQFLGKPMQAVKVSIVRAGLVGLSYAYIGLIRLKNAHLGL